MRATGSYFVGDADRWRDVIEAWAEAGEVSSE